MRAGPLMIIGGAEDKRRRRTILKEFVAAAGGEVLVSDALVRALGQDARVGAARELVVKGKSAPVRVYPLLAA